MNVGGLTLHLHNYSYFPYELDLAGREIASIVGPRFHAGARSFRLEGRWSAADLWRLTYFAQADHGAISIETLQRRLEKTHFAATGKSQRRQSTRYSVHGLHEYKGKFNPQVAHALLNIFGATPRHRVLDPFCGSGTTLVEAAHLGISGCGLDLNPFAVFLANTKLAALTLDVIQLRKSLACVLRELPKAKTPKRELTGPRRDYLDKWFTPDVLASVEALRVCVGRLDKDFRSFFLVIASNLLRDYSLQDPADLRIRRRKTPLPTAPFADIWKREADAQISILERVQPLLAGRAFDSRAILADVRGVGAMELGAPFDFVITSPPYATALPYIDTQRLSLVLLGLVPPEQVRELEADVLGSREIRRDRSELAADLLENRSALPESAVNFCRRLQQSLGTSDGFRRKAMPLLLYRYLSGMKAAFAGLYRLLRTDGRMAWVVGVNQTTLNGERIVIDTPALLCTVAEQVGFEIEPSIELQAYQRYGMHQKNSIREEAILLFRK